MFWRQIIYITSSHRSGDQANTKLRPLSFTSGAKNTKNTKYKNTKNTKSRPLSFHTRGSLDESHSAEVPDVEAQLLAEVGWKNLKIETKEQLGSYIRSSSSNGKIPSFSRVFLMETVPKLHLKMNQDPDCLLAGRPLTQFDLYVSTLVPLRSTSKILRIVKKTLFLATSFPGQMFSRQWRAIPYFSSMRTQN